MNEETIETRRKRLIHRARYRGFREADILIGGFAAAHVPQFDADELEEFEALLTLSDHDLYQWVTGATPAPANISGPVFDKLCAFDASGLVSPRRS